MALVSLLRAVVSAAVLLGAARAAQGDFANLKVLCVGCSSGIGRAGAQILLKVR